MIDQDDVVAISLHFAMRDLEEACSQLSDPRWGWLDFFEALAAVVMLHGQHEIDWDATALRCARETTSLILDGF